MEKKYEYVRKTVYWQGKQYTVRGKTEAEAYEKLGELKANLKRGDMTIGENTTVERWYQEWLTLYKESAGLTKKSLGVYDEKFNGYIGPVIGRMKLKDVRDVHLQKILNSQVGKSYSHVSKLRMVMKELFSRARKSRLIVFDPSEDLTLPDNQRNRRRALTAEERRAILTVADTHYSGLWVLTMLYTGMRPGETAALQWKDIDFERNEIHVYQAVESGSTDVKGPKTDAGIRDIPIHAHLRQRLLAARNGAFAPVFPTRDGNRQNSNSLS